MKKATVAQMTNAERRYVYRTQGEGEGFLTWLSRELFVQNVFVF